MNAFDLPIRVLAVVGAATLGALFFGWLLQVLAKLAFAQKVPRWPLWGTRVLGGVSMGVLAWLWLFGGGTGGLGGTGGYLPGGAGKAGSVKQKDEKPKEKDVRDKDTKTPDPTPTDRLHVEVLGDEPLRRITPGSSFDPMKRYRIVGKADLFTLEEIKKKVLDQRKGTPPLTHIEIIVYRDSPARDRPQVADLAGWARDLPVEEGKAKLRVDFSEPDRTAPVN